VLGVRGAASILPQDPLIGFLAVLVHLHSNKIRDASSSADAAGEALT